MLTPSILEAALAGLEAQRERLSAQIAEVRRQLGVRGPGRPKSNEPEERATAKKAKRTMSAAARKAIAAAQKKRWAAYHAAQK
jgi:hypothetical protein